MGILDLFLNQGLFGGGGLLGGGSPMGGLAGSEGNDQIWSEQPSQMFDPKARQRAAMKQGLLYAGAGLASGQNWGEGLSKGLLGMGAGMNQGREAYMQDAAFNMQMQKQQADQQRQRSILDAWGNILQPTTGDTPMGGGPETPFNLTPAQRQLANTLLAAGDTEGLTKLMMEASQPSNVPGPAGELQAAIAAGMVPPTTTLQDYMQMDQSDPSLVKEYEYAKGQGYTGSLFDFKRDIAAAGATEVNVPGTPGFTIYNPETGEPMMTLGEPTAAGAGNLQTKMDTLGRVRQSLDAYRKIVTAEGTTLLPGSDKTTLKTQYNDLLLEMKELYNLGVLNGPDLDLMQKILTDPTSPNALANLMGPQSYNQQLDIIDAKLQEAYGRLNSLYAGQQPSPAASPSPDDPLGLFSE